MARDNLLLSYIIIDLLFVVSGGLLIIFALMTEQEAKATPTLNTVARDLLLFRCPLNGQYSEGLKEPFGGMLMGK
jgi:fructose-specific phosphotransferase system IIC component